jgi:glutamate synthase (NADPH/NADH) large chain
MTKAFKTATKTFEERGTAAAAQSRAVMDYGLPAAQGLYDPRHEKDSCGVGFVADMKGRKSHTIIEHGIKILENLEHRGAVGADPRAGDGAGMLVQIPHKFFAAEAERLGFALPEPGFYAVGHGFGPRDPEALDRIEGAPIEIKRRRGRLRQKEIGRK